jgi:GH15 family glucan-1,4-alpha-glucosidase
MYTIRGEWGDVMAEQDLTYLDGYRGSRPVRIGNGAAGQRQLDVYGELLDSAYRYVVHSGYRKGRRRREANRALHSLVVEIAEYVADHWQDPDRGIWEVRGDPKPFVYSRAMCWVALERACRLSNLHGQQSREQHWREVRDAIYQEVMQRGFSERLRSFTQFYDADVVDAANLRLPLVGFIAPDDPHMIDTLAATIRYLHGPNGLIYRYRPAEMTSDDPTLRAGTTDDGLPGMEGAFVACTFWLIQALCRAGRIDDARERFEHMIQFASPLGLFAEEIDPDNGAHLGNFHQAFTHVGLINAADMLQRAQEGKLDPAVPEDH